MMKVTLVGDFPPPVGGIAIHVKQLHGFLKEAGIAARVLDIGKGRHETDDVTPVRGWLDYARHVSRLAASDEIVHLHISGNNTKAWAVAASLGASLSSQAIRVITVHSGLMPAFVKRSAQQRLMVRGALAGYQQIIAVSDPVRDALVSCGVSKKKIVVHPAFLASQVRPGALPVEFGAMRARRQPLLSFAHHPSPVYGREMMFLALRTLSRRYPDIGLAVFGPGTRTADFEEAAKLHGVGGLIENLAELPHEQSLSVIAASDAFIRPTTADGDSISVREALTLNVPCVASDVAQRPVGTHVFDAKDAGALCDAVCAALAKGPTMVPAVDAGPVVLDLYSQLLAKTPRRDERAAS